MKAPTPSTTTTLNPAQLARLEAAKILYDKFQPGNFPDPVWYPKMEALAKFIETGETPVSRTTG